MAKQAADGSTLNVGIGINGHEEKAVLHHRDLPKERPAVFSWTQGRSSAGAAAHPGGQCRPPCES